MLTRIRQAVRLLEELPCPSGLNVPDSYIQNVLHELQDMLKLHGVETSQSRRRRAKALARAVVDAWPLGSAIGEKVLAAADEYGRDVGL